MSRSRIIAFALLCVVCLVGAVDYVALADRRQSTVTAGASEGGPVDSDRPASDFDGVDRVLYRSTDPGDHFGQIAVAGLTSPVGPGAWTGLNCERVDYAGGRGLCLVADRGAITTYAAIVFGSDYGQIFRYDLPGLPSRARVSPDGKYGATTTFVSGDSYAGASFSTRTQIFDLQSGEAVGDLEQFTVHEDGEVLDAVDHNFWGVTFAKDSNRFYATLGTGSHHYLIEGDLAARSVEVLRDGVECPSLSPDGTRIAFKSRHDGGFGRIDWRLSVLDLATLEDHPLAETASVDDQAEWLDDANVLYSRPKATSGSPTQDTWEVPADGSGAPREFIPSAYSTSAIHN